ncbi:RICIN domain-containing protein [Streptomyces sp900105755]|uniref:RICIN domain-containing protein n=1 Tax=Streptomyces sp. 900105755 TaxID=3154389 RepID=UPI003333B0D8
MFGQLGSTTTNGAETGSGMHSEAPPFSDGTSTETRSEAARSGGGAQRAGSRGAFGVVGVVGLLAAGSVITTLALIGGRHGDHTNGSSGTVSSSGRNGVSIDGLDAFPTPTSDASGVATDKHSPTVKATKGSPGSTAGEGTASTASSSSGTKAHAQAPPPGLQLVSHSSGRCIDIVGGKASRGARLMISACSRHTPSQHWVFASDGSLRTLGMCVQLAGGSTDDGTDLELAPCNGHSGQKFTLNSSNDLVNELADKCTDVRDNGTADGTRLQLWSCTGTDNQKWSAA